MTWEVGDVAVCVNAGGIRCDLRLHRGVNVTLGEMFKVAHVGRCSCGCELLYRPGEPVTDNNGGVSRRFRKIRPDAHEGNVEDWNLILEMTKRKARA